MFRGDKEYQKFKAGKSLTYKQAILAQCFICNGEEEGGVDCQGGKSCPLYQYMPYRSESAHDKPKRKANQKSIEALRTYRESKTAVVT